MTFFSFLIFTAQLRKLVCSPQFDYKISIAIQANLPRESFQTLLVYNAYDERETQNTNGVNVARV